MLENVCQRKYTPLYEKGIKETRISQWRLLTLVIWILFFRSSGFGLRTSPQTFPDRSADLKMTRNLTASDRARLLLLLIPTPGLRSLCRGEPRSRVKQDMEKGKWFSIIIFADKNFRENSVVFGVCCVGESV